MAATTPFAIPASATLWTALSLAFALVAGLLTRKWTGADRRQKEQDEKLARMEAALDRARTDGDLPRQCTLLRELQAYRRKHGLPVDP